MADITVIDDPGGMYTADPKDVEHNYDVRKAIAYCAERGISPEDLSDKELRMFEIPKT